MSGRVAGFGCVLEPPAVTTLIAAAEHLPAALVASRLAVLEPIDAAARVGQEADLQADPTVTRSVDHAKEGDHP